MKHLSSHTGTIFVYLIILLSDAVHAQSLVLTRPDGCAGDQKNYEFLASRCAADPGSRAWSSSNVIRRVLAPGDMSRPDVMRCTDIAQWANLCRYPRFNNPQVEPQQNTAPRTETHVDPSPNRETPPQSQPLTVCIDGGECFDSPLGDPNQPGLSLIEKARIICGMTEPGQPGTPAFAGDSKDCIKDRLAINSYAINRKREIVQLLPPSPRPARSSGGTEAACITRDHTGRECMTCTQPTREEYQWKIYCTNVCNRPMYHYRLYPGDTSETKTHVNAMTSNFTVAAQPLDRDYPQTRIDCK